MVSNDVYSAIARASNPCIGCTSLSCTVCACYTGCESERDELRKLRAPAPKKETKAKKPTSCVSVAQKDAKKISISREVFGDVGKAVVCPAYGNGMIGAGIYDGDYIIFNTELQPQSGDILMVKVNGELCCRRYFPDGDKGRFRREDGVTQDVITADFTVLGVMVGLMRKVERAG